MVQTAIRSSRGRQPLANPRTISWRSGPVIFPGAYTLTETGCADVGPLTAALTIESEPVWTNQASVTSVTRASGLTITWTGGSSQGVLIAGASFTDSFFCRAAGDAGTFTVPPSVLLALQAAAAGPNGVVTFQAGPAPVNFTANGLIVGSMDFNSNLTNVVTLK